MKNMNKNKCKSLRGRIFDALVNKLSIEAEWVQRHIANCPRCQRRLASIGKVELAFSLLKSQPHSIDLLKRANSQAIGVLKHELRSTGKAEKLKRAIPMPKLYENCRKYQSSVLHAAACVVILLMLKSGVFKATETFKQKGDAAIKNYYAKNAGEDIMEEIFSA